MKTKSFGTFMELNELAFSQGKLEKVVLLYSKIMGKELGGIFVSLGMEDFKRKSGEGKGYRFVNNKGIMVRFNWDAKMAKKAQFLLTSIDYWNNTNANFQRPTRTVKFAPNLNVIQVLSQITDALKTGHINEATEIIEETKLFLFEARTKEEKIEWLEANGLKRSLAGSKQKMRDAAQEKGLSEQIEVFLGEKETNSFEGGLKEVEKSLDQKVFADPDTVFEDIEDLLSVVASGKWRTLIVCGQGGIGKTYHITEGDRSLKALLGSEGDKWTYHSGTKAAPYAFYKTLFQERNKIIVFDEADSVLQHKDIIMMLKPILDTSGDNMAEYMSGTQNMVGLDKGSIEDYCNFVDAEIAEGKPIGAGKKDVKLPSKFQFTGGMVFISNMKSSQIEGAIMSRSIFVDVYLAEQDILKRVRSIGYAQAKKRGDINDADIDEILEALGDEGGEEVKINYMTPEYARKAKQVTVRALALGIILKKSGLSRWKDLVALYS